MATTTRAVRNWISTGEAVKFTGLSRAELFIRLGRGEIKSEKVSRNIRLIYRPSLVAMMKRGLYPTATWRGKRKKAAATTAAAAT